MLQGAEFKPNTRLVLIVYFQAPYYNNLFFSFHLTKTSTNIWPTLQQNPTTIFFFFFFHLTNFSIDINPMTKPHQHHASLYFDLDKFNWGVGYLGSYLPWPMFVVLPLFHNAFLFHLFQKKKKKMESLYSCIYIKIHLFYVVWC